MALFAILMSVLAAGLLIYIWLTQRSPASIEAKIEERVQWIESSLQQEYAAREEAMQKVIASYSLSDTNDRIALLKEVVDIDPTVYNLYISLGYAYWYGKGDLLTAEECFRKDLEFHPGNHQATYELTALYASQEEWLSALSWMKETIQRQPASWKEFQTDPRLEELRKQRLEEFDLIMQEAKRKPQIQI